MMSLSVSSVWRRGPSSWRTSSRRAPSACTALTPCNTTYCVSCTTFPFGCPLYPHVIYLLSDQFPSRGGSDAAGLFFLLQSSNTQFIPHLPINNRQWKHTSASVSANSPWVCHCLQQTRCLPKKLLAEWFSWQWEEAESCLEVQTNFWRTQQPYSQLKHLSSYLHKSAASF